MEKEKTKMGVEWSYLSSILEYYKNMVGAYERYLLFLKKIDHSRRKDYFQCALSSFYSSVKAAFDSWLESEDKNYKETIKQYQSPPDDQESLIEMYFKINVWAQTKGPFATLVKQHDPYNAFKNG